MKRLLYKLAFWLLTLSWVGGSKGCDGRDDEGGAVLYGPSCYCGTCDVGQICWESDCECYQTCETDEDCATATMGASDEYYPNDCETIICNKDEGICWEGCETCFEDKHCEERQACVNGRCEPVEPAADGDEDGDTDLDAAEDTEDETDSTPSR